MDRPLVEPRRTRLLLGAVLAVVLGLTAVIVIMVRGGGDDVNPTWHAGAIRGTSPGSAASPSPAPATDTISLSATGDIIMADAPDKIPPNGGRGFFDDVKEALKADLVMGNLEEPLTDDTGYAKCGADGSACFQFRAPPSYAAHLRDGGFDLLNLANNHGNDFGETGHRNTQRALEQHGLKHTGDRGQITVVEVKGVRVAVLGFSPYSWTNQLNDLDQARSVVREAAAQADIVVVQAHMGAEGSDATRVRPGSEIYYGENRGDPIAFSHAVIDAGADLVVGHGPHVMRAMEFYKGRLIAYSLGNFAGGAGTLSASGNLGLGAVLKVSLHRDGTWAGGTFIATTFQGGGGLPRIDSRKRGLALVRSLCERDFPTTGARLGPNGEISPPN
jgi:poly-gamma-glutamate capsule biosynthesis protein CapA/YwtB (metallophosphatase superfamily)